MWVAGGDAHADAASDRAEAQAAYVEARKLRAEGKRAEAIEKFRRAHVLAPTPVTRLELARELEGAGQLVEAGALAASVPALPVTATETAKSKEARRDAVAFSDAIARRIPKVTVTPTPAGAETVVTIDGKPVSNDLLSGEIALDPGAHRFQGRRGDLVAEASVTLAEGERQTVQLRFPEAAATPPPVAPAPIAPAVASAPPQAPPHALVRLDEPEPDRAGITPLVPIAFGLAGAALITGTITGALAVDQASRLEDACTPDGRCPEGAHDLLSTHQTVTTVSTVAFSVAGVAAAVGVVALIVDRGSSKPTAMTRRKARTGMAFAPRGLEGARWEW